MRSRRPSARVRRSALAPAALAALVPAALAALAACGGEVSTGAPGADAAPGAVADADAAPRPAAEHTASFITLGTHQVLSASAGGVLDASRNALTTSATFTLTDRNLAALADGDEVTLATSDGRFLSAANGGGGALAFSAASAGDFETFVLVRVDGPGAIVSGDHVALATRVTGEYVSAIDGGGGQVLANAPWDHAWETFVLRLDRPAPDARAARQEVLDFLAGIGGQGTAIGIENKDSANPRSDSQRMAEIAATGEQPSFWSADWGFGAGTIAHRQDIVDEGLRQWNAGAIVQYIYHACPLTLDETCEWTDLNPSRLDDAQWSDLVTPGGRLNQVWLGRLDTLAPYFQQLKDAGVAPLFRPLHEMNGGWAWWQGRPGPDGSAKLWKLTHDYLVDEKGLDNIVWVWNVQDYETLAADVDVYSPGNAYFDVAAVDIYNTGYLQGNYDAMLRVAEGKPIGVAECQRLPASGTLAAQPLWTYVAMWPDFYDDDLELIPELFRHDAVLTLSEMPGW